MEGINGEELKKKKKFRSRRKKKKLTIVFDENARREFLTGFHKRNLQRKAKAKEELEKQLKAERKKIKARAKEEYMKLLLAQKPIPELTDFFTESIDMGTHSISVTELSTADLARKNNWIGVNEVQYEKRGSEEKLENNDNQFKWEQEFEGMELGHKKKTKEKLNKISARSVKDIKKQIKQQATAEVKKSKVYKKKALSEKIRQSKLKKKEEKLLRKTHSNKHKTKKREL